MSWLNKLTKTVEEGVNRATTEADKAIRVGRITTEIVGKRNEQEKQFQEIGRALWQLHKDGKDVPEELKSRFGRIEELEKELAALEAQREAAKAGAAAGTGGPAATGATTVVEEEEAPPATFCTACGGALPTGATNCPRCGHKVY
jgi:hypothetical protein